MSKAPKRPHYSSAYRKARAQLLKNNPRCHWCPNPATEADHEPPIAVVGKPHLNLVPACSDCNKRRNPTTVPYDNPPSRRW